MELYSPLFEEYKKITEIFIDYFPKGFNRDLEITPQILASCWHHFLWEFFGPYPQEYSFSLLKEIHHYLHYADLHSTPFLIKLIGYFIVGDLLQSRKSNESITIALPSENSLSNLYEISHKQGKITPLPLLIEGLFCNMNIPDIIGLNELHLYCVDIVNKNNYLRIQMNKNENEENLKVNVGFCFTLLVQPPPSSSISSLEINKKRKQNDSDYKYKKQKKKVKVKPDLVQEIKEIKEIKLIEMTHRFEKIANQVMKALSVLQRDMIVSPHLDNLSPFPQVLQNIILGYL